MFTLGQLYGGVGGDLLQLTGLGDFWLASKSRLYFVNGTSPKLAVRTSTPTSNLETGGSLGTGITTITAKTFTISDVHYTLLVDTTTSPANGNVTLTLPVASTCKGRMYVVKLIAGTGSAIVSCQGTDTVDGAASVTVSTLWGVVRLQSNGSNWYVI